MKLSYSANKEDYEVRIAKAQAKADHYRKQAIEARGLLFDLQYPNGYETKELEFKQQYIFFKEELKKVIHQRDEYKESNITLSQNNRKLKALLRGVVLEETDKEGNL